MEERTVHRVASWVGVPGLIVGIALPLLDKFVADAPETPTVVIVAVLGVSVLLVASKPVFRRFMQLVRVLRGQEPRRRRD